MIEQLFIFFGVGLALSLTPCVLTMVPILLNILTSDNTITPRRTLILSSTYILTNILFYTLFGLIAGQTGTLLQTYAQQPLFVLPASALIFILGLIQLDIIKFNVTKHITFNYKQATILNTIIMSGLAVLVCSPCLTPALFAILIYLIDGGSMLQGGVSLFVLALGMNIPLFIGANLGLKYLPKRGKYMSYIKKGVGVVLIGMAAYMAAPFIPSSTYSYTQTKAIELQEYAAKKRIVMYTADWCSSCQTFKRNVLTNPQVKAALQKVSFSIIDVTNKSTKGLLGVPTFIKYEGGKKTTRVGAMSVSEFLRFIQ